MGTGREAHGRCAHLGSCTAIRTAGKFSSAASTTDPQVLISAKIRNALAVARPLDGVPNIEIHSHGKTLYNSVYRYDDEMIVNQHVDGVTAPQSLALYLRPLSAGDLFGTNAKGFD